MRQRLFVLATFATFAPFAFVVVSLLMATVGVADPCPSENIGGC